MSEIETGGQPLKVVLPRPDFWAEPFWAQAARGILALQRCDECGSYWYPPGPCCPACLSSSFEWSATSGKGVVVSWVVFHQSYYPDTIFKVPYNVAIVELLEGPRLVTNLAGVDGSDLRVGLPVRVVFSELNRELKLPRFVMDGDG